MFFRAKDGMILLVKLRTARRNSPCAVYLTVTSAEMLSQRHA